MKFFNQGLSGNIRQRAAHTKLKYTAMANNQKRSQGRVQKGSTFQQKYKGKNRAVFPNPAKHKKRTLNHH